jgi:hypothetical protein
MALSPSSQEQAQEQAIDRRQSPRLRCGGLAKLMRLPSEGMIVPGRVLDLSLGGCGIETGLTLPAGTRAEILLRVNAASIRVVGQVHSPRRPSVIGVEFVLVSAGGKHMLAELIRELARQQAITTLRGGRSQPHPEASQRQGRALLNASNLVTGSLIRFEKPEPRHVSINPPTIEAEGVFASTLERILHGDELDLFI